MLELAPCPTCHTDVERVELAWVGAVALPCGHPVVVTIWPEGIALTAPPPPVPPLPEPGEVVFDE